MIRILILMMLLPLLSCSGGEVGDTGKNLGGTAAVGEAIIGGNVVVICSSGNLLRTRTDSFGRWSVGLAQQVFPCAVQVSGGKIYGNQNALNYHAIALAEGVVNVSPLTDMVVANLVAKNKPTQWFASLYARHATLSSISAARVEVALSNLRASLSALPLSTINPLTAPFSAEPGNAADDMLAAIKTTMKRTGIDYALLLSRVSTTPIVLPAGFASELLTAYAGTASGGATVSPASPDVVSVDMIGAGQISIKWNKVSGADGYNLYRSSNPNALIVSGNKINQSLLTTNSFEDTGVSSLSTYYYRVTAVNLAGESESSAEVSVTTKSTFVDDLLLDSGGFVDIPLHNATVGDSLSVYYGKILQHGTLVLASDALSVRYQSSGLSMGEEKFSFLIQRQSKTIESHDVTLMVRRTDQRPNILFVLTDDQNVGMEQALPWTTANIRDRGIDFRNSFVPLTLCCPSRASILTGKYPHNHQVKSNMTLGWGGAPQFKASGSDQQTIAVWLQQAGYATAMIGKYMNQYPDYPPRPAARYNSLKLVPPGWSEWHAAVDIFPDDSPYTQYNFGMIENGKEIRYGQAPDDYFGDVVTAKTEVFINRAISKQKPFFAYVSYISPHTPGAAAPRHVGRFSGVATAFSPSFNEVDVSDKPVWGQLHASLSPTSINDITSTKKRRLESLLSVDEGMQRLVAILQSRGELGRTYIIFTSDNGFHAGEHRLSAGKQTAYEEDTRVPLWIRGPNIPEGKLSSELIVNIDLAPTFNEWAGNPTIPSVDGRSLVPVLTGSAPLDWRKRFLIEHFRPAPSTRHVAVTDPGGLEYFALHDASRIFVEYSYGDQELYNLANDPYQLQNIISIENPLVLQDLSSRLQALKTCSGDACRYEESRP